MSVITIPSLASAAVTVPSLASAAVGLGVPELPLSGCGGGLWGAGAPPPAPGSTIRDANQRRLVRDANQGGASLAEDVQVSGPPARLLRSSSVLAASSWRCGWAAGRSGLRAAVKCLCAEIALTVERCSQTARRAARGSSALTRIRNFVGKSTSILPLPSSVL